MGLNFRKSINVGPLRFNISKSGVGISTGIRGLRIGTGPRGNYVHVGIGGLYYRTTFPTQSNVQVVESSDTFPIDDPRIPSGTHAPLEEIKSVEISQIKSSSSQELLQEINEKNMIISKWPIAAVISMVLLYVLILFKSPSWLIFMSAIAMLVYISKVHQKDLLAKTVVLFYEFDADMEKWYDYFYSYIAQLAKCSAVWHIKAKAQVHDRKYHAGASSLVQRMKASIKVAEPPFLKTNIDTISINLGQNTFHFFPDRIFMYTNDGIVYLDYKELTISVSKNSFVEDEALPRDAEVIEHTWRYVNKSMGPDRRFKNNPQLPVCLYEEITFSSLSGVHEVIQLSRCGYGEGFAEAVSRFGKALPN